MCVCSIGSLHVKAQYAFMSYSTIHGEGCNRFCIPVSHHILVLLCFVLDPCLVSAKDLQSLRGSHTTHFFFPVCTVHLKDYFIARFGAKVCNLGQTYIFTKDFFHLSDQVNFCSEFMIEMIHCKREME